MTSGFLQHLNNIAETFIPGVSLIESVVDNFIRDKVSPEPGAIIYCSLYTVEHSGIYVGEGKVVELLGKLSGQSGCIAMSDRNSFKSGTNALTVYVACYGNGSTVIASDEVAKRAIDSVGNHVAYNLLRQNCHMFTSGCITGNFSNHDNLFMNLQNTIREKYGDFNWRAWN